MCVCTGGNSPHNNSLLFKRTSNISSEQLQVWTSQWHSKAERAETPLLLSTSALFWLLLEPWARQRNYLGESRGLRTRTRVSWTLWASPCTASRLPPAGSLLPGRCSQPVLRYRGSSFLYGLIPVSQWLWTGQAGLQHGLGYKTLLVCGGQKAKGEEMPLIEFSSSCLHSGMQMSEMRQSLLCVWWIRLPTILSSDCSSMSFMRKCQQDILENILCLFPPILHGTPSALYWVHPSCHVALRNLPLPGLDFLIRNMEIRTVPTS